METVTTEQKPRVFIVNFAGHDYTNAERFGEFVHITRGYVNFNSIDRVKFIITEAIAQSEPDDFLLLSGKILINVIAVAAWMIRHKRVRLLHWDDKSKAPEYREVVLSEKNFLDMINIVNPSV